MLPWRTRSEPLTTSTSDDRACIVVRTTCFVALSGASRRRAGRDGVTSRDDADPRQSGVSALGPGRRPRALRKLRDLREVGRGHRAALRPPRRCQCRRAQRFFRQDFLKGKRSEERTNNFFSRSGPRILSQEGMKVVSTRPARAVEVKGGGKMACSERHEVGQYYRAN